MNVVLEPEYGSITEQNLEELREEIPNGKIELKQLKIKTEEVNK